MSNTIVFLIDSLQVLGGAERNLLRIVSHLNPAKYNSIVCCLKNGKAEEEFKKRNINIINLDIKRIYNLRGIIQAIKLIAIIKKNKVKIMVTCLESSDFWGSFVAKIAGVPVLISNRRDLGFNLQKRHVLAYRLINRLFDRIIAVSNAVKEEIVERQKVNSDKVITIYNGVEINEDYEIKNDSLKDSLGLDKHKQTVIMLANLDPIKGHKDFLAAAAKVLERNKSVQFLLVGSGKHSYELELKSFANRLGIENDVVFTGYRADISQILSISDISVLTSSSEGLSNAILESMSASKPVVAIDTGGNSEAVINGKTGILVPPKNINALANSILYFLENKNSAKQLGEAARQRIEKLFTLDRMIEDIETLFDVLRKKKTIPNKTKIMRTKLRKFFKVILSGIFYYSGITSLYERTRVSNTVIILAYHKVLDDHNYLNLSTKVLNFRKQMEYLRRRYQTISLDEALNILKTKKSNLKRSAVVVTFDDGSKDIFHNALPILKEFKIPATVFLTVSPIENRKPLWFEFVTYAIENSKRNTLNLESFGLGKYLINSPEEKKAAASDIVKYIKKMNKENSSSFLKALSEKLLSDAEIKNGLTDNLTWEEIKEMRKEQIDFGAHTMNHHILTNLTLKEAEDEIIEAKRIIESRLGEKVSFFAYPNGGPEDFNEDIVNLLKKNNFSCACTLMDGINDGDIYTLKRINIHDASVTDLRGSFCKSLFAAKISGIFKR